MGSIEHLSGRREEVWDSDGSEDVGDFDGIEDVWDCAEMTPSGTGSTGEIWWSLSGRSIEVPRVKFRLTEERQTTYNGEYHVNYHGHDLDVMKDVTHWEVVINRRIFEISTSPVQSYLSDFSKLLLKRNCPVPNLKYLKIDGHGSSATYLHSPRPWLFRGYISFAPELLDVLRAARRFSSLQSLIWENVGLRKAEVLSIGGLFSAGHLQFLSKLSLADNGFGPEEVEALASSLQYVMNTSLRFLNLSGNNVGRAHSDLVQVIKSGRLPALETLHLRRTHMGVTYCEAYEEALSSGSLIAFKEMDFSSNVIGSRGAEALGRSFLSGKVRSLTVICLQKNGIRDDGILALTTALEVGSLPQLTKLDVGNNPFGERGLKSLAQALGSGNLNSLHVLELGHGVLDSLAPIASRNFVQPTKAGITALIDAFSSNISLTVDLRFNWSLYPVLERRQKQLVKRNRKHCELLATLGGTSVPATFGKVYICGNPQVGKTTLRKSLQRSWWKSFLEIRQHQEKITRGIEVSKISSEGNQEKSPVSLVVWDMAGQNEYHMLHNAFLPALAYGEGKATIFIILCTSQKLQKARQELEYWLRFITASYSQDVQNPRDVFVVVNRMNGDSRNMDNEWKSLLSFYRERFQGCLRITDDPFIIDVRKRKHVQRLKRSLIERSRIMLQGEYVPEICDSIQKNLSFWSEKRKQFPTLSWREFLKEVKKSGGLQSDSEERALDASVQYLNESGVLIFIDKEFPAEWYVAHRKLVVLDPNWFCKEIVGNMFLPPDMGEL